MAQRYLSSYIKKIADQYSEPFTHGTVLLRQRPAHRPTEVVYAVVLLFGQDEPVRLDGSGSSRLRQVTPYTVRLL